MRPSTTLYLCTGVFIGFSSGCGSLPMDAPQDAVAGGLLQYEIISRDGRQGLQMTNNSGQCIAVAFTYGELAQNDVGKTACHVPAQTRVVYWQTSHYHILDVKPCKQAGREGFGGIATAAQLQVNYQSGRCDIVGVFAD